MNELFMNELENIHNQYFFQCDTLLFMVRHKIVGISLSCRVVTILTSAHNLYLKITQHYTPQNSLKYEGVFVSLTKNLSQLNILLNNIVVLTKN